MNKNETIRKLKRAGQILLDLLYPRRCPICQRILAGREGLVCADCRKRLPYIREPRCMKCGKPLDRREQEYCPDCERGGHEFIRGRSVFLYEKGMRKSVHRMKFQNRREYLDFYAEEMARAGGDFIRQVSPRVLVPIPMHPRKRRERGFDQSRLLAEKLGELTGIPVERGVIRNRYTLPQKQLDARERKANLRGAFSLREGVRLQEPVLLIDDIYTTGATVDEVCRTLHGAGITRIYFLGLCTGKGK